MKISRRQVIHAGTALTGLSLALKPEQLLAQAQAAAPTPANLVDTPPRTLADLPLAADGSAPEHAPGEAGDISEPTLWRYTKGQPPPDIEVDYRKLKVKITAGGVVKRSGTMTFADLEPLPRISHVFLLQCGAANPRGIVKWTGVRFADVANMLGVLPSAAYCRFVAADRYWSDEEVKTVMNPQVMLAWMLNDAPIPPKHGAPLRLVIPFRYGARSLKAISEIQFTATSFAGPALPSV